MITSETYRRDAEQRRSIVQIAAHAKLTVEIYFTLRSVTIEHIGELDGHLGPC